ncbi:aldo/keto reductase [Tolypothrix bouteillei VB521301_2]|uniref:aldo/keto reductase n=1 Tax=Tolypothrix bouteillei TaxID=1246981 RepID=UPI000513604B
MQLTTYSGQKASILGLAAQQQMEAETVAVSFEALINYFFFYNLDCESFLSELKLLLATKREQVLVATGSESREISSLNRYFNWVRDRLNVDAVDVFFVEYVSPDDDTNQVRAILDELHDWKEKGLIRYVGVTTHNRPIALEMIESGQCDVLMHRYNMAHRKAQEDVLPSAQKANIPLVAFTCTRWGSLLKGHPHWQFEPPTAADCYRYVLDHPAVHLALTAPKTKQQLAQNLSVLHASPLSPQEIAHWQEYGDLIYGSGQDAFDTQWV